MQLCPSAKTNKPVKMPLTLTLKKNSLVWEEKEDNIKIVLRKEMVKGFSLTEDRIVLYLKSKIAYGYGIVDELEYKDENITEMFDIDKLTDWLDE